MTAEPCVIACVIALVGDAAGCCAPVPSWRLVTCGGVCRPPPAWGIQLPRPWAPLGFLRGGACRCCIVQGGIASCRVSPRGLLPVDCTQLPSFMLLMQYDTWSWTPCDASDCVALKHASSCKWYHSLTPITEATLTQSTTAPRALHSQPPTESCASSNHPTRQASKVLPAASAPLHLSNVTPTHTHDASAHQPAPVYTQPAARHVTKAFTPQCQWQF